ncbi:MAG: hypothetical protein LBR71_01665 [Synergistaceae bacterium]|jgi:hypothetical protein|nr:hypothetical protein [Synergistaceae bacterium]
MNYIGFAGWLFFMTWVMADTIPRYVAPHLGSVCDTLENLASGGWGTGRMGFFLSLATRIVLSAFLTYILMSWSVWCVLRCFAYTQGLETGRALYFVTGFLCCEYALGKIAKVGKYRGFFISVLPFAMAMGAFVVFTVNPRPIAEAFPWLPPGP